MLTSKWNTPYFPFPFNAPAFPNDIVGLLTPCFYHSIRGLGLASTPVRFSSAHEQSSISRFEGTKYDTVQGLELIGAPSRDEVQVNIQELSSLLEVTCPMRRTHRGVGNIC
jgi:hypothetical protein